MGGVEMVAADDYFMTSDGEYLWDPKHLGKAHEWCQRTTKEHLDAKRDVIVHNTFTTIKEFHPYLKMASKPTIHMIVYNVFDGGLTNEALHRRNVHGVPEAAIAKMRNRFQLAPIDERVVHIEGTYAYWQFPNADWVDLDVQYS